MKKKIYLAAIKIQYSGLPEHIVNTPCDDSMDDAEKSLEYLESIYGNYSCQILAKKVLSLEIEL